VSGFDELLEQYKPQPRYDRQEAFFADAADQLAVNPGNELHVGGKVMATAETGLTLASLGPVYKDKTKAGNDDALSIQGKDYRDQYTRLRQSQPALNNWIYGHAKVDGQNRLWLQYWFFYFYNDYQLAGGIGLHEGDWEMVQLRMKGTADQLGDSPDIALYAQHAYAESKSWDDVELTDDGRPVTYPGRGSHASYFAPGVYETEGWYDIVDGRRPTPELQLKILPDKPAGWVAWPGTWGDTRPETKGIDEPSPTGPAQHQYWDFPDKLQDKAIGRKPKKPAKPPKLNAARRDGELWVMCDFRGEAAGVPLRLLATVNSREEKGVPPKTFTFDVAAKANEIGQFNTKFHLDSKKHYEVDLSITVETGGTQLSTASRCVPLDPGVESKIPGFIKSPVWHIEQFFSH
jgi:hypothetical protein